MIKLIMSQADLQSLVGEVRSGEGICTYCGCYDSDMAYSYVDEEAVTEVVQRTLACLGITVEADSARTPGNSDTAGQRQDSDPQDPAVVIRRLLISVGVG